MPEDAANGTFKSRKGSFVSYVTGGSVGGSATSMNLYGNPQRGGSSELQHYMAKYGKTSKRDDRLNFTRRMKDLEIKKDKISYLTIVFPILFFGGIACATVLSYMLLRQSNQEKISQRWIASGMEHSQRLSWVIENALSDVSMTARWLELNENWRAEDARERFNQFTDTILELSTGTQGLTWVPMITDQADRDFLEQQTTRQTNLTGTRPDGGRGLWQVGGVGYARDPPTGGPWRVAAPDASGQVSDHAYYPVFFLNPMTNNEAAILLDLSSNSARNASISKAILTDGFATTSRLLLVQEDGPQFGFITFYPVYHSLPCARDPARDPATHCKVLQGLANAVFRIQDLVRGADLNKNIQSEREVAEADSFLLDLGVDESAEGYVGSPLLDPEQASERQCGDLALYREAFFVDELFSSLNKSAAADNVVSRLGEVLPAMCRELQHKSSMRDQIRNAKRSGFEVSGTSHKGTFIAYSFFVGDRRWLFIKHSQGRLEEDLALGTAVLVLGLVVALAAGCGSAVLLRRRAIERRYLKQMYLEEQKTLLVLRNIFPDKYVPMVLQGDTGVAERYDDATIVFSDIVGFTSFASMIDPKDVVEALNVMYNIFDRITEVNGVYKVETIGDGYMISSGCPDATVNNSARAAETALDMRASLRQIREQLLDIPGIANHPEAARWAANCQIRVGMHTGTVFAGIAGMRNPRFHLFGDTVNTASRMESNSRPGCITVSQAARAAIEREAPEEFKFQERGGVDIKGKGMMQLFFLVGRESELDDGNLEVEASSNRIRSSLTPDDARARAALEEAGAAGGKRGSTCSDGTCSSPVPRRSRGRPVSPMHNVPEDSLSPLPQRQPAPANLPAASRANGSNGSSNGSNGFNGRPESALFNSHAQVNGTIGWAADSAGAAEGEGAGGDGGGGAGGG